MNKLFSGLSDVQLVFDKYCGLYFHIPFCSSKCFYCNFCSITDLSNIDDYFAAINVELSFYRNKYIDTIYFGGGTPSVVSSFYIAEILENIFKYFHVDSNVEITIEINPGTITKDKLFHYYVMGVNRLNIGVQSMDDSVLNFLGRSHNVKDNLITFFMARDVGFKNLGVDLIYGVPGQSCLEWEREMSSIVSMYPEHISCYLLSFEPKTVMGSKLSSGLVFPSDNSLIYSLFMLTGKFLSAHGYSRYEISNFAKYSIEKSSKYRAKHNSKYWDSGHYIGFGASAYSFMCNKRWWNCNDIERYISSLLIDNSVPIVNNEDLFVQQQIVEFIYLKLRQNEGINIIEFKKKFGVAAFNNFMKPEISFNTKLE